MPAQGAVSTTAYGAGSAETLSPTFGQDSMNDMSDEDWRSLQQEIGKATRIRDSLDQAEPKDPVHSRLVAVESQLAALRQKEVMMMKPRGALLFRFLVLLCCCMSCNMSRMMHVPFLPCKGMWHRPCPALSEGCQDTHSCVEPG